MHNEAGGCAVDKGYAAEKGYATELLRCPFCGGTYLTECACAPKKRAGGFERRFFRCAGSSGCGGFFVSRECFLPAQKQKERYLLHDNSLANAGYRSFLKDFADTALNQSRALLGAPPATIFDYGCGNGALIELLQTNKKDFLLPADTEIRGWDPLFAPAAQPFPGGADLVLCLEVAEHFENPAEGFAGLSRACKRGGLLAVRTLFAPESEREFKSWWYKEDPTHVSFYTQKALTLCAKDAGFEPCGIYNNCSIFRAAFPR